MKSNHVGGLKRSLQNRNDSKINKRKKDRKMGSFYVSVKLGLQSSLLVELSLFHSVSVR